jgi:integrase-like protein
MVRDLMLEAVELRFGTIQARHAVEWLSDNGSPFTASETLDFATALGLVPCFTAVRSPESNGIAEAFVRTFKRDYARVHPLPDAATVLRQIAGWFDDYNESHPHSGLGMISPREFIRSGSPGVRLNGGNTMLLAFRRLMEPWDAVTRPSGIAEPGAGGCLLCFSRAQWQTSNKSSAPSVRPL